MLSLDNSEEANSILHFDVDDTTGVRSSRPSPELGSPSALGNDLVVPSSVLSSHARSSKRARQFAEEDSETNKSPKRARVDQSSEDAVDAVVAALRQIMAQEIEALTAEQDALMEAQVGPHWALFGTRFGDLIAMRSSSRCGTSWLSPTSPTTSGQTPRLPSEA